MAEASIDVRVKCGSRRRPDHSSAQWLCPILGGRGWSDEKLVLSERFARPDSVAPWVRCPGFRPQRGRKGKPRATPWVSGNRNVHHPEGVEQNQGRSVVPFQGTNASVPWAMPWAFLFRPFQGLVTTEKRNESRQFPRAGRAITVNFSSRQPRPPIEPPDLSQAKAGLAGVSRPAEWARGLSGRRRIAVPNGEGTLP